MVHRIAERVRKVLIVTTVSGFVPQFEMNNVRILQSMGYEVHYASNYNDVIYGTDNHRLDGTGITRHQVDFERSPFHVRKNLKAYRQLKKLMAEQYFDLVHCHTPMGAALARIAAKSYRKQGTKVIYTAHGFHFYKGAPLKNWLLFYPAEFFLASVTDELITINKEDYERAKKFCKNKKTRVAYIPGVGVDTAYFGGKDLPKEEHQNIRREVRRKLNVSENEVVFLSVGELSQRKNHMLVLQTFAEIEKEMPSPFFYFICGQGVLKEELERQAEETGLSEKVRLLGYQEDIRSLLYATDVFVFPSIQEGMPMALMEAVAAGVPVVASDIRGNRELVSMQEGGQIFKDKTELKELLQKAISRRLKDRNIERQQENITDVLWPIDKYQVSVQMKGIYKEVESLI